MLLSFSSIGCLTFACVRINNFKRNIKPYFSRVGHEFSFRTMEDISHFLKKEAEKNINIYRILNNQTLYKKKSDIYNESTNILYRRISGKNLVRVLSLFLLVRLPTAAKCGIWRYVFTSGRAGL